MPTFIPRFKLYASDGVTLIYTFLAVQSTNAPQSNKRTSVIEGLRGNGCIVIQGSEPAWDLVIRGVLVASDYEAITTLIDALESAVSLGTKFILTFDKSPTQAYSWHVMRITPINYSDNLRTCDQEYEVIFKTNSW
jgi:hypothetical protein